MKEVNLVYDFDGTLTNNPMPQFKILKDCGFTGEEFDKYAAKNKEIYGYYDGWYITFLEEITRHFNEVNNSLLSRGALDVVYNRGVIDYFKYFKVDNINIKHYIVTSGIKVYIENTIIYPYIEEVYGTTFKYNNNKVTGVLDISSSHKKVDHIKSINISNGRDSLDCSNLIYFGDGMTDIEAFKFVKEHNGISILVSPSNINNNEELKEYINKSFVADYSLDSELVKYIKEILSA